MGHNFNIVKKLKQWRVSIKFDLNFMGTYFVNMEDEVKLTNILKTSIEGFNKNLNQV